MPFAKWLAAEQAPVAEVEQNAPGTAEPHKVADMSVAAGEHQPTPEQPKPRTYLAVPFGDKDEVKHLGAKWDRKEKSWYITPDHDPAAFAKWSVKPHCSAPALTPQEEFAAFLKANGLELKGAPEMDGEWHRVPTSKDKGKERSGSYRGFLDGRPAGQAIKGWNEKAVQWVATGEALTEEERARIQAEAAQVRADREAAQLALVEKSAKTAYGVWQNLPDSTSPRRVSSPYLASKGVGAHGVKIDGEGKLVVPARDADGKLWTIQFIGNDSKLWLKDSRKAGTMHVIEPTGKGTLDTLAQHGEGQAPALVGLLPDNGGNPRMTAFLPSVSALVGLGLTGEAVEPLGALGIKHVGAIGVAHIAGVLQAGGHRRLQGVEITDKITLTTGRVIVRVGEC